MPSSEYFEALADSQRFHQQNKTFSGKFLRPHGPHIKEIIDRLGCQSVLDYGCGKGEQYEWVNPATGLTLEQSWGVTVTKYDPAWPPFAAEPEGKFDLVICTHVLGAIPVIDLGWAVDRIFGLANKAVYVAEAIGEPKKNVFTNKNAVPAGWTAIQWIDLLSPRRPAHVETHLSVRYRRPEGTTVGRFLLQG